MSEGQVQYIRFTKSSRRITTFSFSQRGVWYNWLMKGP
jgi:hypothetical protein